MTHSKAKKTTNAGTTNKTKMATLCAPNDIAILKNQLLMVSNNLLLFYGIVVFCMSIRMDALNEEQWFDH
ncbi:hypothetical protein L4D77_19125 [Photobacterium frigidiphilum]|uniref:hypothetical protein n=1 Tax=Photobacterium frigidiphilum TaxID=264736 RepID=UPI003D130603